MAPLRSTLGKSLGSLLRVGRGKDLAGSKEGGAALDGQLNSRYFRRTPPPPSPSPITGGTVLPAPSRSGYRVHEFTSSGSLVVPTLAVNPAGSPITQVELLVCAPGGGGGFCNPGDGGGGGGGGGAVYYDTTYSLSLGTTYTVTLPEGGEGSTSNASHGSKGGDAVFGPLTIEGGGGGGSTRATGTLPGGGCTGGAASDLCPNDATPSTGASWPSSPTASSPPVGFGQDGGDNDTGSAGAGGGGAGGAAGGVGPIASNPNNATPGGEGISYSISGSAIYYGGGGGGGAYSSNPPAGIGAGYDGPTGGGGPGGLNAPGENANGVGGGGGGGGMPGERPGGDGSKGRVYVAYPSA